MTSCGRTLGLSRDVWVDVNALLTSALLVRQGEDSQQDQSVLLVSSELLPGWYDEWVLLERERLRQLRLPALEDLGALLLDRGRMGEAIDLAMAAVRAEPLRESAQRLLIRLHLAEGNRVEAQRQCGLCAELLFRELGVAPGRALTALLHQDGEALPVT